MCENVFVCVWRCVLCRPVFVVVVGVCVSVSEYLRAGVYDCEFVCVYMCKLCENVWVCVCSRVLIIVFLDVSMCFVRCMLLLVNFFEWCFVFVCV